MDMEDTDVERELLHQQQVPPVVALDPTHSQARLTVTMTVVAWLDLHQQPGIEITKSK